jgi:6-phosphofructokinase 1
MHRVFLSFHFDPNRPEDELFVQRVKYYLRKQVDIEPYSFDGGPTDSNWRQKVGAAVSAADFFVLFVGADIGNVQREEAQVFLQRAGREGPKDRLDRHALLVKLADSADHLLDARDSDLFEYAACRPHLVDHVRQERGGGLWVVNEDKAEKCAGEVVKLVLRGVHGNDGNWDGVWIPGDGLPTEYLYDYEKRIIEEFVKGQGCIHDGKLLAMGCPQQWPEASQLPASQANPIPEQEIGSYRPRDSRIIVDVRRKYHDPARGDGCLSRLGLEFAEAGPRAQLYFPRPASRFRGPQPTLQVGIVVSGGIAPGVNAVIAGIVERHHEYLNHSGQVYQLDLDGFDLGFAGLSAGKGRHLDLDRVRAAADRGGSIIATARCDELLDDANNAENRAKRSGLLAALVTKLGGLDILYVIGGDGSMSAAHALYMRAAKQLNRQVSIIAIPKTMDNDILWVWQSFGFLSAVEKAREFARSLHTEVSSNPRLCVAQLFGSESGFVVSHAALASGVCDLALIPEVDFTMDQVLTHVLKRFGERSRSLPKAPTDTENRETLPYGLILMAETAIPKEVEDYLADPTLGLGEAETSAIRKFLDKGRRVYGQTPDELRRAGLKIVSGVLQRKLQEQGGPFWSQFRVVTSEPRHLIRAIEPSVQDVILGHRLGMLAVDSAMAGYTDVMISQWLTEYVLVPLPLVVLGRKRVPGNGIFWKAVLAATGHPNLEMAT